uniref:Olfactory receptor n=1 Tax=Pelusios castaneus TaxID=367368 RepID=A0A8C8VJI9_9SAUR
MKYAEESRRENLTLVTEFILLGLPNHRELEVPLFFIYLLIYAITLIGNILLIIITVAPTLQTPMYFFLRILSFLDVCYTSVTIPKMLVNFLSEDKSISYLGCTVQMYFLLFLGASECFLLATMAYDRYVAICNPMRYRVIMNRRVCFSLAFLSWFGGNLLSIVQTTWLHFCGPNQISHYICELPALLQLSCTVNLFNQVVLLTSILILGSGALLLTLVSYIHIISTILRIRSAEDRHKAFSTCSSHLIVVGLFYLTGFIQYTKPSSVSSVVIDEMLSIQYSILTPMLNPIIYSLKNKEVKMALGKILIKFKSPR